VTDARLVERTVFPPVPASVAAARRFVGAIADRWGFTDHPIEMALVVSELVTNAVEHGDADIVLVLRGQDDGLCIEVTNTATGGVPERRDPPPSTASGRGLRIVDVLSAAWGHVTVGDRLTVWALVS
jgi:anti-sigma regulatory factor (Ser/Thr protein kinase)